MVATTDMGYGDGTSWDRNTAQVPMKWYDESTSELTGTNYPKIKQFACTHAHTQDTNSNDYGSWYAVDTEGYLYSWGYNGYGQLVKEIPIIITRTKSTKECI